jgi:hypothetical protein
MTSLIAFPVSESHMTVNIDMSEVPDNLKCALSSTFLREAVTLHCCQKVTLSSLEKNHNTVICFQNVNDSVIRQELVNSGLKCPLCGAEKISPDSVRISIFLGSTIVISTSIAAAHYSKRYPRGSGGLHQK